jgi:hypothetical protein
MWARRAPLRLTSWKLSQGSLLPMPEMAGRQPNMRVIKTTAAAKRARTSPSCTSATLPLLVGRGQHGVPSILFGLGLHQHANGATGVSPKSSQYPNRHVGNVIRASLAESLKIVRGAKYLFFSSMTHLA